MSFSVITRVLSWMDTQKHMNKPKSYLQVYPELGDISCLSTSCLQYLLFVKSAAKSASQELMPRFQGACINLKSFISNHPPSCKFFFFWLFARLGKFWFLDFLVSENNFLHCNSHSKFHYIAECTRTAINVIWQTHNKPFQNSIILREISFTFGFLPQLFFLFFLLTSLRTTLPRPFSIHFLSHNCISM